MASIPHLQAGADFDFLAKAIIFWLLNDLFVIGLSLCVPVYLRGL